MQKLMRMMHKQEEGFTLVELMVVVVIIGILVAIAIPIYSGIQENARISAHEANIRTLQGSGAVWVAEEGPQSGENTYNSAEDVPTIDTWPEDPWDENGDYFLIIEGDEVTVVAENFPDDHDKGTR